MKYKFNKKVSNFKNYMNKPLFVKLHGWHADCKFIFIPRTIKENMVFGNFFLNIDPIATSNLLSNISFGFEVNHTKNVFVRTLTQTEYKNYKTQVLKKIYLKK